MPHNPQHDPLDTHSIGMDKLNACIQNHKAYTYELLTAHDERMFDWAPSVRCHVPAMVTSLPA